LDQRFSASTKKRARRHKKRKGFYENKTEAQEITVSVATTTLSPLGGRTGGFRDLIILMMKMKKSECFKFQRAASRKLTWGHDIRHEAEGPHDEAI